MVKNTEPQKQNNENHNHSGKRSPECLYGLVNDHLPGSHLILRNICKSRYPTDIFKDLTLDPEQMERLTFCFSKGGLLFHGDNKEVLAHLLTNGFRGEVNLCFIDPSVRFWCPICTRKISLRGVKGTGKN